MVLLTKSVGSSGGGSTNDKGWFATELALTTAYPVGQNGWFAIVGTTDSIWLWDGDTNNWIDTGEKAFGDMLKSIYDPAGGAKQVAFEEDVITKHNDLNNRDSNDSHPISAITDLQSELDSRTAYYYHELDQADSTYYYFGYLQVGGDKRRIRRVNKSDYSVGWAVGDTDYADYWLNRELLDYNPTL